MQVSTSCFNGSNDPVTNSGKPELTNPVPESGDQNSSSLVVVSFYKFADFPDHANLRKPLKALCEEQCVSGGIILAPEGINGSICGTRESVERVLGLIQSDERLKGLRQIESPVSPEEEAIHHGHTSSSPLAAGEDAPFRWDHVRVKMKKEIVTLGMPSVSPIEKVGKYVKPREWNTLISDPDTVVIDVRNDYETRIGKFKGAVDPLSSAFHEFPSWVEDQFQIDETADKESKVKMEDLNEITNKEVDSPKKRTPKRVAMYCTGGIRCEKASSFLLSKGFEEVYHLEGGILKYLEKFQRQRAFGRVSALCLTNEYLSSMVWHRGLSSFAMDASNQLVMPTWNPQSGSMELLVLTVTHLNLKKRKRGLEHDNDNSRLGAWWS